MRKLSLLGMILVLALGLLVPMMAQATAVYAWNPPPGNEGCTPGYWKNHTDSWPSTLPAPGPYFDDATIQIGQDVYAWFNAGPHVTLLDALSLPGGGENALVRHAAAAILNAASPDVNYPYSGVDIIAGVHAALSGMADVESVKDLLDAANNLGCGSD